MEIEKLEQLYRLLTQFSYELPPNDSNIVHLVQSRRVVADNILQQVDYPEYFGSRDYMNESIKRREYIRGIKDGE